MGEVIKIACQGAGTRPLDDLIEFQGELKSLSKENYQRLKKEIIIEGFAFPVHIWTEPETQKTFIIGGHQRIRTLKQMRDEEGYEIPPIPVSIIHARDWKQAKRRVLQDVAQYGKVERQGLYDFITHADIEVADLIGSFDLPEVEMDEFKAEFYDDPEQVSFEAKNGSQEMDEDEFDKFEHKCPRCSFEFN